jgi:VIT1/CCC1 family predicted Fe2+/Mn2+ transporter
LHDALGAHARDELGITDALRARPIQASLASAGSFCLGALCPVLMILLSPAGQIAEATTVVALIVLAALGALAAHAGGAPIWRAAFRMLVWGALALGLTALVGRLFGAVV